MKALALPTNDLSFGVYPQRQHRTGISAGFGLWRSVTSWCTGASSLPSDFVEALNHELKSMRELDDIQLRRRIARVGIEMRRVGVTSQHCAKAIGAIAEVMRRTTGQQPYRSQMLAAYRLLRGELVEMKTGEGKTLAVAMAAAAAANAGSSVFVLTANDYLVSRDYSQLKGFFRTLSLTVGYVTSETEPVDRQSNWRRQIVYSSAREMAFDYLRDHLQWRGNRDALSHRAQALTSAALDMPADNQTYERPLIPGLCFCIVDEADSLLLDEATMPLIIADQAGTLDVVSYEKAYQLASQLQNVRHFRVDRNARRVALTLDGVERVEMSFKNERGDLALTRRAIELVETAVAARLLFVSGRDYAVVAGDIALIDELTGRVANGRQWQGALNAMVQIKEGLVPTSPARTTAQITYQDLFPRFMHLCGTSGTLRDARREFRSLYGLTVSDVARSHPCRLHDLGTQVVQTAACKWAAVVEAVTIMSRQNRPVLIGNASVQDSTQLSELLTRHGIRHQVLHATQCVNEAISLARAGRAGVVTVSTNIAGRGTDIKLTEIARRCGGLHVIATMRNRSRRIDRQLNGRAGRQGDPGSYQSILSLDDKLIQDALPASVNRLAGAVFRLVDGRGQAIWCALFSVAQRIEQSRDYFARSVLQSVSHGRYRLFSFVGRPE